jgi:hypothetical protein
MPRLPSAGAAARASGLGVGAETGVRVLRSMWWNGWSRSGISITPSSSYDHVPSSLIQTWIR